MGARISGNRRNIKFSSNSRLENFKRFNICCPEMATEIYAARCMLYDVLEKIDNGEEVRGAHPWLKFFPQRSQIELPTKLYKSFGGMD
ncbi:acyl-CoA dehydrogenase family protein [Peribacillus sp. NPDC101480]|uniref:acyl-CoA dehydrogenase family protein n=1 Tax=Peribacillus sp. NPDC101480 TaxID=3390620 RepID=UPI003D06A1BC